MSGPPYDPVRLRQVAGEIVTAVRELAARGWTPATSSNFSMRLDEAHAAETYDCARGSYRRLRASR